MELLSLRADFSAWDGGIAEVTGRLESESELIHALWAALPAVHPRQWCAGGPNWAFGSDLIFRFYEIRGMRLLRRRDFRPRCPLLVSHGAALQNPNTSGRPSRLHLEAGRPMAKCPAVSGCLQQTLRLVCGARHRAESSQNDAKVGLLSELKNKIKGRIYLNDGVEAGKPYAAFFLYDKKDSHLDNSPVSLRVLVQRSKVSPLSGKYNNVYSGTHLRGAAAGRKLDACWWFKAAPVPPASR
ncbi:MAG: hypothetical protein CM1200mP34_1060 [Verrucomicrobiales bacterium]|nr:MAG: hypothetical protein CM1200mP34_1060 [Verrucomicrobiales bacterium]